MKKNILAVIMTVMLTVMMTGCGKSNAEDQKAPAQSGESTEQEADESAEGAGDQQEL